MTLDIDRFRGSLLGLAVDDALCSTVDFSPRGTFALLTDMPGGGRKQITRRADRLHEAAHQL